MGFFDFFKVRDSDSFNVPINKYYRGYDSFYFVNDNRSSISLRICKQIEIDDYSNLYICDVRYGHVGARFQTNLYTDDDLYCFDRLVIGLDKERMINSSKYTEFVFSKILDRHRISRLHDIEFGYLDGKKNGNYVGSVYESNGQLIVLMDDNIGDVIEMTDYTKYIHQLYDEYMSDKVKKMNEYGESAYIKRQQRVKTLKEEFAMLAAREEEFQKSKNK